MAAVTAVVPSLSQVEAWSTDHLESAATHWSETAETWEHSFTTIHREAPYPGGTPWEGAAADAAVLRTGTDRVVVVGAADSLHSAAKAARYGADEIAGARQLVLQTINAAREAGFTVGEDLSVATRQAGPPALQAARQAQAQAFTAAIRTSAQDLVAVDTEVAGKVSAAIAGVNSAQFGDISVAPLPPKKKPTIQAVDNRTFKDAPPIPDPGTPDDPVGRGAGPSAADIRGVLDKLPEGNKPWIREVRTPQDLENLWKWMQQNGIDRPGGYGDPSKGMLKVLPDGTTIGQRLAADSTGRPALDINIPDDKGYTKVHINPRGGVPEIPAAPRPAVEPPARLPTPVEPPPVRGGGLPGGFGGGALPGNAMPHIVELPHPGDGDLPVIGDGKPDVPKA